MAASAASRRLGEYLVAKDLVSVDDIRMLIAEEESEGIPLPRLLIDSGLVGRRDLIEAVAFVTGREPPPVVDDEDADEEDEDEYCERDAGDDAVDHVAVDDDDIDGDSDEEKAVVLEGADVLEDELRRSFGVSMRVSTVRHGRRAVPDRIQMEDLLDRVLDEGASDLHLTVGAAPSIRVEGRLVPLPEYGVLGRGETRRLVYELLDERQRVAFERDLELDTSHTGRRARFRVNVFRQRDAVGA